ncbi:feruloyl coa ortho-hydroxylase 1 [Phtheirospermum japonicum]|uniref:feruloyl-CoA 6-hydroxylase n=1 Tax=Phtheirospermum japonicum TaxID=374723 RepID=A0A830CMZ5_9LAMI|nr:feruloyl coa ortho-hydroxylase 1 [Phtheirospermum japonicum]
MELSPRHESPSGSKALFSFYSKYIFNRLRSFFPISVSPADVFLSRIRNFYGTSKRRRRKTCLPLPLPSAATTASLDQSSAYESTITEPSFFIFFPIFLPVRITSEACKISDVLEDIIEHALQNLHSIQKNLGFWQSRAEGSSAQKAYFMICERGPSAFISGTLQLIRDSLADGSSVQKLYFSASSHISERISVLTSLRYSMATFLAKVYMEVDRFGEDLVKDPKNSLPSLLVAINDLFLSLEASIGHFHANRQSGSSVDGSYSLPLMFAKLPEVNQGDSQWTDCEITDAINLIYENLRRLDSYLSVLVFKHRKPRKVTLHWMRYSCGVFGITVGSLWLLRHSRLMGSSDIDNWIREAKDSTISFWNDHVEQPVLAIRDELFETFRKRQKGVMEREEVQLTADSLHRMLLTFSEQTVGKKIPANTSDQEMLEIVMARYEKEISHPIQGLMGGELVRGLLIQVQKLKLDIEEAMLELDQILRANEINFAILAALPAFFLSLVLAMLVRAWFKQASSCLSTFLDTRAEGRGRVARVQRRLLVVEIERAIMQFQICKDQGLENDAQCMYGLALCFLDSLYCVVENHAKATGEWICLRQDIVDLAKPGLETQQKLSIASRLVRVYDCLLPSADPKVAESICEAAKKWGFFQIINHGVPIEVLENVKRASHDFFELPAEERRKYLKENCSTETVMLKTSFNPLAEKVLEWKDYLVHFVGPENDEGFKLWPSVSRDPVLEYIIRIKPVIRTLLKVLLNGINVKQQLDEARESALMGSLVTSLLYYPKCPNPDLAAGVGPHSDISSITVLLQDDVGGLYVRVSETDRWVHVAPTEGSLVVNIGDVLQIMSNDRYKSVEHRVFVSGSKNRVSVPVFVNPSSDVVIGPLPEVMEDGEKPKYKRVVYSDYFNYFFSKGHDGKLTIDYARI